MIRRSLDVNDVFILLVIFLLFASGVPARGKITQDTKYVLLREVSLNQDTIKRQQREILINQELIKRRLARIKSRW